MLPTAETHEVLLYVMFSVLAGVRLHDPDGSRSAFQTAGPRRAGARLCHSGGAACGVSEHFTPLGVPFYASPLYRMSMLDVYVTAPWLYSDIVATLRNSAIYRHLRN